MQGLCNIMPRQQTCNADIALEECVMNGADIDAQILYPVQRFSQCIQKRSGQLAGDQSRCSGTRQPCRQSFRDFEYIILKQPDQADTIFELRKALILPRRWNCQTSVQVELVTQKDEIRTQ